ncbi:AsmA-like C-terminal region-containing protein [Natronoflexus pectinivorans]|uniref:AsmA-like protein n=1 Tax=Natronoflexus pectinivorans TaxID=682526 RepID=A0A4R2GDG1_9BACT|nr:AsmA-like C-terminal region-containing protein [Natronoflexus pectinivorans]TCO06138.1 AsmA-like protein [Natronoflexus pectinivorans]
MKRYLKPAIITVLSVLVVLFIIISVALWLVFTPERLTPIVRKQAEKHLPYHTEIGEVELTFFSTFPQFGLRINELTILSPFSGAKSDTLLHAGQFTGIIDFLAWWKNDQVIIEKVILKNGLVNLFTDSTGNSNFSLFLDETEKTEDESDEKVKTDSEFPFDLINLKRADLDNLNIYYTDLSANIVTEITQLTTSITGKMQGDNISGSINLKNANFIFLLNDMLTEVDNLKTSGNFDIEGDEITGNFDIKDGDVTYIYDTMEAFVKNISGSLAGTMLPDHIEGNINISQSQVTFGYDGETYLNNASVIINAPSTTFIPSRVWLNLDDATASVNQLAANLSGTLEVDTVGIIHTNMGYQLENWRIREIIAMVPPAFHEYLEGIEIDGIISSTGMITGIYSDSVMPLMDIKLQLTNGSFNYAEYPLPMRNMNGDVHIFTDLADDAKSFVRINRFNASTANSSFTTSGVINRLFSDIHTNLSTRANLWMEEFNHLIPEELNTSMKGRLNGRVRSNFSMSQMENMELEKMRFSGSATFTEFEMVYDTISLKTNGSKLDFTLPNPDKSDQNPGFAQFRFSVSELFASVNEDMHTTVKNGELFLETSDFRDSTRIPQVICTFNLEEVYAEMDTIRLTIRQPNGKFLLAPMAGNPEQPDIELYYKGDFLELFAGENNIEIGKVDLRTGMQHVAPAEEDFFMQWLINGFLDMSNANFALHALSYPVQIPVVKMDFDPENFNFKEGRMMIGNSDFHLSGEMRNILSWIRGDSILTGRFNFDSDITDVTQLMSLTSGLGIEESVESLNVETSADLAEDGEFTGPYMVPQGVDFILQSNIRKATFGVDTARNVLGEVIINDGILVLQDLTFSTSAAEMQMTSIYRTPRKNHLYLGLDFHMLDIQINELLNLIPDIDTIMPMLRSFKGTGEFHIAVETYMDSTYTLKMSTLRGASSIVGNDLVLMDGETFSKIARRLWFSRKAENKVDTLSAEFTIFEDQVDIYPFLIVMDRYGAVISGNHNLDMTFDYHISLVRSPLPFRLGLDVKGTPDRMRRRLAWPQYGRYYRPSSQRLVANKQLELRDIIRQSLLQNLRRREESQNQE